MARAPCSVLVPVLITCQLVLAFNKNPTPICAFSGDTKHSVTNTSDPETSTIGVIATSQADPTGAAGVSEASVLVYNSGVLGQPCTSDCKASITIEVKGLRHGGIMRHFRIDQVHGNPRGLWDKFGGETNPYPTAAQFAEYRAQSTLSLIDTQPVKEGGSDPLSVTMMLPQPGVSLLHFCMLAPPNAPPVLAKITGVSLRATPTKDPPTTFIRWEPLTSQRCLAGYEVTTSASPGQPYTPLAGSTSTAGEAGSMFSYHVHVQPGLDSVAGCYKVRAIDVWGGRGPWSDVACH